MIYFDNAATSLPKPPRVAEAMVKALNTFGGAGRGGHQAALDASRCIFRTRQAVAGLLGGAAERTVFTANATESLNIAICGLLTPADHAITTVLEHNSVLRPLYRLQSAGMGLSIVGADAKGNLDYDGFKRHLRPNTKAVVCTHASNLTGSLADLAAISVFCKENSLLLIVDSAQTAGVFPINTAENGIDVLCFTGHKGLMGPQGTGGLCIGEGIEIPPLKVGGSGMHSFSQSHPARLPESLEAGTPNAHGLAGLLAGVEFIEKTGMDTIRNRELALTQAFYEGVKDIEGVTIYGDFSRPHGPIVTLNVGNLGSAEVGDMLARRYDICVRCGAHCAPLAHGALGTAGQGSVRFSFSYFNRQDELEHGIEAVAQIARLHRG